MEIMTELDDLIKEQEFDSAFILYKSMIGQGKTTMVLALAQAIQRYRGMHLLKAGESKDD